MSYYRSLYFLLAKCRGGVSRSNLDLMNRITLRSSLNAQRFGTLAERSGARTLNARRSTLNFQRPEGATLNAPRSTLNVLES